MTTRARARKAVPFGLVVLLGLGAAAAQPASDAARGAAEAWVRLVDAGQYGESWQAAGAPFRNAVPQQKWIEAVQGARTPLGAFKSRTMRSMAATRALPGAPDGDYMVMEFDAVFEKKSAAAEVITVLLEPDEQWRVVGYFVR